MTKMRVTLICAILSLLLISSNSFAASGENYWPNWRGPDYTGVAKNANPPVTWNETENIKWKKELPGEGISTPIVWENKIIFLDSIEVGSGSAPSAGRGGRGGSSSASEYKFVIVCIDRETGDTIWRETAIQTTPHEGKHNTGSFASNSAVTDGKYIWAGFGSRGVYCFDMDGKKIWEKDLGKMKILMSFGEGSSIALAGDAIIVVMDQEDQSKIYALNKENGEILWEKNRDEGTSWATPLPMEVDGNIQVITSATKLVRSYDVKTGDVIWQCSGQTRNVIPSPVPYGNMVICTSGFSGNKIQCIELGHTGDLSGTDAIKWEVGSRTTPYVPSPMLYGDRFYVLFNNNEVLSCYNAKDGKPLYESQKLDGAKGYYASPVGAADRVYLASQNGTTVVVKNADTYEVLATNKLDDNFDASPVIVGDQIILKGHKYIYCIEEK
ncbi:MAG: PQQ-like beta-propeller repeat protein [Bacteroidales bacterium]|nr:PQQ-like beta-propeller repeat protein [Bacteroidales bacterium]